MAGFWKRFGNVTRVLRFHILHFVIGLFTLGIWWLVWVALALFGGEKRMSVGVDEWGNTNVQEL